MRISSDIMIKTRARCPCCGTRLNENAIDREIDLTDERDVMEQEIGGYGGISSGSTSSFENYPKIFLMIFFGSISYLTLGNYHQHHTFQKFFSKNKT
jgi:hypothetical protein